MDALEKARWKNRGSMGLMQKLYAAKAKSEQAAQQQAQQADVTPPPTEQVPVQRAVSAPIPIPKRHPDWPWPNAMPHMNYPYVVVVARKTHVPPNKHVEKPNRRCTPELAGLSPPRTRRTVAKATTKDNENDNDSGIN